MTIKNLCQNACQKHGSLTAFHVKENKEIKTVSFRELDEKVTALANGFLKMGLSGCNIIVSGKNSYNWILCGLAAFYSGNVLVPLDAALPIEEYTRIAERSEARAIFYAKEIEDKCLPQNIEIKMCMDDIDSIMTEESFPSKEASEGDLAVILFTSGTTSNSKAVMLSHKNIVSNIEGLMKWEELYPSDINLALLPLFHAFGLTATLLFLTIGASSAFCEGLRIKKAFTDYHISVFVGVPLILDKMKETILSGVRKKGKEKVFGFALKLSRALMKMGIDVRRKLFKDIHKGLGGNLRLIITGAAAISPETARFYNDIGILLIQGYGLSETAPVLSAENPKNMRLGSVGKALPGIDIKIDNPDENGVGEIIAKGDNIMLGYKDEPSPIIDGYFHTGDVGYIDKDGYIFINGRMKNVIVLPNGKNVFPEEIESHISEIKGVKESVVYMSEEGKAVISAKIVYDEELTNPDLLNEAVEKLNQTLADFKKIRRYEFTKEEFIKTSTGKIKRNLVQK